LVVPRSRPSWLVLTTLATALAAAPIPLLAQELQPAAPQQAAGWVFTPSLGVGGAYDDNLLIADIADEPPGDYATPLTPSASLEFRGRRTLLSSGYNGAFFVYRSLGELNSADHHANFLVSHRATRQITLFAQEQFSRSPSTDALEVAGIPFFRVATRSNIVRGGVEAAVARHTELRASYGLRSIAFGFDERLHRQLQGGYAHEGLVGLQRRLSARLSVGAQYDIVRAVLSEGLDRFNTQTGSVSIQYAATPRLSVSGLLGLSRLDAGLTHSAQTGPAMSAGVTHRGRHTVISGSYQRSFVPSYGFGGTFQNEEWGGSVQVPFARRRAYVNGTVSWSDADALEAGQASLQSLWLSSTVGYRATPWLSAEAFYGRSEQQARLPGGNRARNQIGFRLLATRPMKLR
jgi:hypothetical protein